MPSLGKGQNTPKIPSFSPLKGLNNGMERNGSGVKKLRALKARLGAKASENRRDNTNEPKLPMKKP